MENRKRFSYFLEVLKFLKGNLIQAIVPIM